MKLWRPGDILIVLMISLGAWGAFNTFSLGPGQLVEVFLNNEKIGWYPLNSKSTDTVKTDLGSLVIQIDQGKAEIIKAPCPNKICLRQKAIEQSGESIVCLPSRLFLRIPSDQNEQHNAIDGYSF